LDLLSLEIEGFRNLKSGIFHPQPGINLVVGDNGQGKTNLLEAIGYVLFMRSIRGFSDQYLVQWESPYFRLKGEFGNGSHRSFLQVSWHPEVGKKVWLNGVVQQSFTDYLYKGVYFSPDHLKIVKGGPSERRIWLDQLACQFYPGYHRQLVMMKNILAQRNHMLKLVRQRVTGFGELEIWDLQLAKAGSAILTKRLELLKRLSVLVVEIYGKISGGGVINIDYCPTLPEIDQMNHQEIMACYGKELERQRMTDIQKGVTGCGPHRDDLSIVINGKMARTFGSQGQQRTVVLSMKMAEVELLRLNFPQPPLLLLDDVFSELDEVRCSHLLDYVRRGYQTFITAVNDAGLPRHLLGESHRVRVRDGYLHV